MGARPIYRILHTEWSDGWGGQERRILSEMVGMRARGHQLFMATRAHAAIYQAAQDLGFPVLALPFSGKFNLKSILGLRQFIYRENIEIVNTHSGIDSWVGALAAWKTPAVLVRTRHLNLPLRRHWYNFVHLLPARIVTCGEVMRRNLIENCGFPADEVVSIPTGIDFESFQPRTPRIEVRTKLKLAPDDFMILMVGVIRGVKRHEVALRAFACLQKTLPEARLILAGEGPMRGDMEALAQTLNISDKLQFLGHRDDIPDLLAAADCTLLSSRSEGVPQALTQALGLGLPAVATAVGGVPELIEHEESGLLCAPEDIEGIAAQLKRLALDASLRERLGRTAQKQMYAKFSQKAMLDATELLYAGLFSR